MKTIYTAMISILVVAGFFWLLTANEALLPPALTKLLAKMRGAFKSRTVQLNALFLLLMDRLPDFIGYMSTNLPMLQPYIPANHYTFAMGAIVIANMILRFKTTTPLEAK